MRCDMFLVDDGWAIASHIALSALMALFPFLIVLTALAGFFGSAELADQAAELMLDTWPDKVADAIAVEIHNVLTVAQGGVLTIGLMLAIYFASNGVESLRVGLNRAYSVVEMRRWYWLRLESIGYTLLAAVVLLSLAFLIVLAPLMIATARRYFPIAMEDNEPFITFARLGLAVLSLIVALFIVHKWLPAGNRRVRDIIPGILLDDRRLAGLRHPVRQVSGGVRQQLRDDLCGPRLGHHRAGVPLFHRLGLRLWRRVQRRDHEDEAAPAARERARTTFASTCASARGETGFRIKASAPAASAAFSSSSRPDSPTIATSPCGAPSMRMRRIASTPLMPGSTMSISTTSNAPCASRSLAFSPSPMNSV